MQFIAFLLLSISLGFAKGNFCDFDSDFAEKYMEARSNYAAFLVKKRPEKDPSEYDYGSKRSRTLGVNWPTVSLKQKIQQLFGTNDVEIKVKPNGKMLIYPKNVTDGNPVMLFDSSGDYFRISKSKIKNGEVMDQNSYHDINGNPLVMPKGQSDEAWEAYARQTHFKATP